MPCGSQDTPVPFIGPSNWSGSGPAPSYEIGPSNWSGPGPAPSYPIDAEILESYSGIGPLNWFGPGPAPSYPSSTPNLPGPASASIFDYAKNIFSPKPALVSSAATLPQIPTTQGRPTIVVPAGRPGSVGPVGPVGQRPDTFASSVAAVTNAVASIFAPFAAAKAQKVQAQAQNPRNPRMPQVQQSPTNWGTIALVGGGIFVALIVAVALTGKKGGGDARP